jgi:glutamate transport system substrate-binding protein
MTRRRPFKLAAMLGLLALVLAACGDDGESVDADDTGGEAASSGAPAASFESGTTMARIKSAGEIKVGVKFDQPGFGQKNPTSGEVEGFDVEIAEHIAAAIGPDVEVEFTESVSKNREPFLQDGTVDMVVATYTINDTRKQQVDFAGPYFLAQQDIMVKADDTSIKSVTDLNGKDVCSVKGSTSVKNLAAKAPQSKVTELDTYSLCAGALTDGRVVAVSTDSPILAGLVQASDNEFKLVNAPFSDEPYGIGVEKGDDEFREFINDTLEGLYDDGQWAEAFEATLGELGLETPEPPEVDRYESTPTASSGAPSGSSGPSSSGSGSSPAAN